MIEKYMDILTKYQELFSFDPSTSNITSGFLLVDNALDMAHHNGNMSDHVDLEKWDMERLGNLDVPVNPTPEELQEFYLNNMV